MFRYMRVETPDAYGLKPLQDKILQIAAYIDKVCEKNGITYCLMGGSALGAIRHCGFIPWDDDLDIFMKPKDYEKFRNYFRQCGDAENYYLQELTERDGKILSAKLRLNDSAYIEKFPNNWKVHQGIFVDIFILHNTPTRSFKGLLQCLSAKYVIIKGLCKKGVSYGGVKGFIVALVDKIPGKQLIHSCLNNLYKYDNCRTSWVSHFCGKAFFYEGLYKSKYFEKTKRVPFENIQLNVPILVEDYLKTRFGNYMELPDSSTIKAVQHAVKWDIDNDFSNYVNHTRNFSDEPNFI